MSRRFFTAGLQGSALALVLLGCAGNEVMRAEIYEPSAAHVSYGYGGYAAGASAWNGYAGTAPSGSPTLTVRPEAVPFDTLLLPTPTLLEGADGTLTFDAGLVPRGALRLTEPSTRLRQPSGLRLHR